MMHGQLRRYVIPPKDPPPPEKFRPKDYFMDDQRDYEKAPGIKDAKKLVLPRPIITTVEPYACMKYSIDDLNNAWMTITGFNLAKKDLKDVGGIFIVAGEHEFKCTGVVAGHPPPREPSQERNSSSNNSSSNNSSKASNNGIGDEDQNMIDELDELGINDNPVSFLSQVSKLVQQANSKVYNVMGRIAGDAAGAKKSGSTPKKVQNAIGRTVGDAAGAKKGGTTPSLDSVVQDAAGGIGGNEKAGLNATIEDPGRAYESDPKIFHKPTKTLLMLSCKVPNAFIYANHKAGNLVGYVKVVSNSMGPSEPPAWKKLERSTTMGSTKRVHILHLQM